CIFTYINFCSPDISSTLALTLSLHDALPIFPAPSGILRYRWEAGLRVSQPPRPCVGLLEQLGLPRWLHEWLLPCHTCHVGESDQSVRQYSYLVSYSQRFSALWRCAVVCGVVRNYRCVPPATSSPSGSCGTASTTSSILPNSFSGRVRSAWSDF